MAETEGNVMSIMELIRRFTVDQWATIDAEYRKPDARADAKGIGVLLLVPLLLTIRRYYGGRSFFRAISGTAFGRWPFPEIWAYLYSHFSAVVIYFVLPSLFIYLIFRERLQDHGFRFRGIARYVWIYLAMLLVVLPLTVIASYSSDFTAKYPIYPKAGNSWTEFLIWEFSYAVSFIALEFFFRGFMLFTMARYLGAYAIFVMVIPYVMIHFGKPFAETLGSIIAGTALGTLALRTRSIFGGVLIHVAVAWCMDILAILATR